MAVVRLELSRSLRRVSVRVVIPLPVLVLSVRRVSGLAAVEVPPGLAVGGDESKTP